ncbi:MAG: hypothetical protein HY319_18880 [Armatimonadetes bacterium]|nr:hypothetical protein [Armatimonadota bacterium]
MARFSMEGPVLEARPVVRSDLRTPRSTFDSFARAVLARDAAMLWETVHANLRLLLQRQYYKTGADFFFDQLRGILGGNGSRLCLGAPHQVTSGTVVCPLMRAGDEVGSGWFQFSDCTWLLLSLNLD